MADNNPSVEAAKKRFAEDQKASEKSRQEFAERTKGKPTPTQEENDLAALGAHITEHEADGSALDPNVNATRHLEAEKPTAGYQTRQTQARPAPGPTPHHTS
jgi:hypothetical protein